MKQTGIYIHIPFCDHKCIYCDFYSIITTDNINSFYSALGKEIEYYSLQYAPGREIVSIYFGGGTPSLMTPAFLDGIIKMIKRNFTISGNVEVTIEANPGTVDYRKLCEFREAGINRVSIGVQSFNDEELKFLTRIHNSSTAVSTVLNAAKADFENINIDLIFNLPGQTKEGWRKNLETAVSLPLTHISAYSLILERGTILNKMVLDGKVNIRDEDYDAELYSSTINYLTSHGWNQYEVSNFALNGYECIHNNCYWQSKDYLGLGPSSHSFINGKRWWNYSSLKMYIGHIMESGEAQCGYEFPDKEQRQNEYVMLALRSSGIDITELSAIYDPTWILRNEERIRLLQKEELLSFQNGYIKLTPRGYALCDEILSQLS